MSYVGENRRLGVNRRWWLQASAVAGVGVLLAPDVALAETTTIADALRAMSPAVTGAQLPQNWVQPVAGLVGIILDSSKSLRALDLRDIEPVTTFTAG